MKATLNPTHVLVTRSPDDKRARTEAHFWGMLRDELNESYQGEQRYTWVLFRPHKEALTSMPFGLSRGPNREEMITDDNYALRQPHQEYNKREPVRLTRLTGRK